MRRVTVVAALVLAVLFPLLASADSKLDNLIVYGEGFIFGVKEPSHWKGDIDNAKGFYANIIFYPASEKPNAASAIICVRVYDKADEDTAKDLSADMKQYQVQYPGVKFKDISVSHPNYRCFPKLFYVPESFYEYVVYLNPGRGIPQILSVSMNKQKTEASAGELSAFQQVVQSLLLFQSPPKKDQEPTRRTE
jgi:hypothetical protein